MERELSAEALAAKAEKALKILKISVIVTAVCAVALPAVSLILLICADRAIYGLIGLGVSLGVFVAMLTVLACVFIYVRKCIKAQNKKSDEREKQ